jgi:uncharacterized protein
MPSDVVVFKKGSTYAAFNRLDLQVAYGADREATISAVRNDKISLQTLQKEALEKKVDFRVLYLMLTDNCNFDCSYCYEKGMHKRGNMSAELAEKAIRMMFYNLRSRPNLPYFLHFYGGEPLLNFPVLKSATLFFRKETARMMREAHVTVVTNGSLLTREIAKFLKDNQVIVCLSVDGRKAINDSERKAKNGSSTYESIVKAFRIARSVGLNPNISFTIGPHNMKRLRKEIAFLNKTFKPGRIVLNPPVITSMEDLKLAREAFCNLVKLREYLWDQNDSDGNLPLFVKRFVQRELSWHHCQCHRHQLVVRSDGVVGPCLFLQNNSTYFNTTVDTLSKSYTDGSPFEMFTRRLAVNIKKCSACPALMLCRGGCAANVINIGEDINSPDPLMCCFSKGLLEELIWSIYKLNPSEIPL